MHLLLTDRLTCPRCGPPFGLILLAEDIHDRSVISGRLGCPNCRDSFAIEDGFADLRAPPRGEMPVGLAGGAPATGGEDTERIVALLGMVGGPGTVALVGEPARYGIVVARAVEGVHVVAVDPDVRSWPEEPRVSRIAASPGLPFFDSTLRAVAVDGRLGAHWLTESARVVARRGRVVVVRAGSDTEEALLEAGLQVLASEAKTIVAVRT